MLLAGCPAPELDIRPEVLPVAVEGAGYEVLLSTDDSGQTRWQVVEGALPPGLVLEQGGRLAGTPLEPGDFEFLVEAADRSALAPATGRRRYSMQVIQTLRIGDSLPPARVETPYHQQVPVTGGVPPYQVTVIGLPAGLGFDPETHTIAGTPPLAIASAAVPLDITVVDSGDPQQWASIRIDLAIRPLPVTITTSELPDGRVNEPYSLQLTAVHGILPYRWTVDDGLLPDGSPPLRLGTTTGLISGVPTEPQTRTVTIKVTDGDSPPSVDSVVLTITILP